MPHNIPSCYHLKSRAENLVDRYGFPGTICQISNVLISTRIAEVTKCSLPSRIIFGSL